MQFRKSQFQTPDAMLLKTARLCDFLDGNSSMALFCCFPSVQWHYALQTSLLSVSPIILITAYMPQTVGLFRGGGNFDAYALIS